MLLKAHPFCTQLNSSKYCYVSQIIQTIIYYPQLNDQFYFKLFNLAAVICVK